MSGRAPHRNVLAGILAVVVSTAVFATMDAASKHAIAVGTPLLVVLWGRYFFQALGTTAIVLPRRGAASLRTRSPGFQLLRGALLACSSLLVFASLRFMPVGELTAIMMIAPLVITGLAGALLGEVVSPARWALVATGFVGTLVIIRPGGEDFTWTLLLPLGQVACNTAFQVLTGRMARTEDPMTMHLYTGWIGTVLVSAALLATGTALHAPGLWAWLVAIGALGAVGHFLLIVGYQRAPAMTLTPYMYLQIGFAMLAGWVAFGHVPDAWSAAGMALIAASGVAGAWLSMRERRPV